MQPLLLLSLDDLVIVFFMSCKLWGFFEEVGLKEGVGICGL
jgi:hypothetical protein